MVIVMAATATAEQLRSVLQQVESERVPRPYQ